MSILAAERLSVSFGGVHAIDNVSLAIEPGMVFSIIGPNGAGKTTLFNLFSGLYVPHAGRVRFAGEDVTGFSPDRLARRGLSRTFQNLQLFFRMTVLENVMVGRHRHEATSMLSDILHLPSVRRQNRHTRDAARAALNRVALDAEAERAADAFPMVRSSASRSPVRWQPSPRRCCSMSPPPAAIRSRQESSMRSSVQSQGTASLSCWSSMTCVSS